MTGGGDNRSKMDKRHVYERNQRDCFAAADARNHVEGGFTYLPYIRPLHRESPVARENRSNRDG